MTKSERIAAFARLGKELQALDEATKSTLFDQAAANNPWFTEENIGMAFAGIVRFLDEQALTSWIDAYPLPEESRKIGLVLAGNIPLVGFHDFLAVLITGHQAIIKLSSQDKVLLKFIAEKLIGINPEFRDKIVFVDKLAEIDAVIATGSDNSSRYFKKYFQHIPHIIRQNRTSMAVLSGEETETELTLLSDDIFSYFGLGCRNVAKVFIPQGYDMPHLLDNLIKYEDIKNHPKYFNNYEYNKAIFLVNSVKHLDTGYALFTRNSNLFSPLSVVYYEEYSSTDEVIRTINANANKIQCVVSNLTLEGIDTVALGQAQFPEITDYADNVDTVQFLCTLPTA